MPQYVNTAKNEFYDLTDPNAPKLLGNMTDYARTLAEQNFQNYLEGLIQQKTTGGIKGVNPRTGVGTQMPAEYASREALVNSDWWKTFIAQEKPVWTQRESGRILQDLVRQTENRYDLDPNILSPLDEANRRASLAPVVRSDFGGPPIQTADQTVFNQPATTERPAEPTFNAAAAGSSAGANYGDVLTLAGGQRISPQDPNYAVYAKQLGVSQPITAPQISTGQLTQENFYIGATNWANLQKQFTPAQLEAATVLIDKNGDGVKERYWKTGVDINKVSPSGAITSDTLRGGQGSVDLSGATAGAVDTAPQANALVAGAQTNLAQIMAGLTPPETEADKKEQTLLDQMASLVGDQAQKAADQLTAEQSAGLPDLKKQFADINSQILTKMAEYNVLSTANQNKPITMASIIGNERAIMNAKAADIGLLQARAQGLQGQISVAQETVNRAIDLKYSTIEARLNTYQAQLNALQPTLNKEEKIRAQAQQMMIDNQKQALADQKAKEKSVEKAKLSKIEMENKLAKAGYVYVDTPAKRDNLRAQGYDILEQTDDNGVKRTYAKKPEAVKGKSTPITKNKTPEQEMNAQLSAVVGADGFISPDNYTIARNAWIKEGLSPTTFDTKFKGFRNPNNPYYITEKEKKSNSGDRTP